MSKNESRNDRKKAESMRSANKSSLNKVYYWIIGILFFILLLLVIYIFANSGDNVDLGTDEETSSLVQESETTTDQARTDEAAEEAADTEASEETAETEAEESEENQENAEESTDNQTTVDENAPLDPNHAVDYSNGSADRIAIKEKVMEATGLGSDLIENWIGNNGPGRVTADVYSPDKSEVYRVYLQYGEGEWHVTNYESLNSIPEN